MEDKHEYKGWLNSDSFWKRAFAVWAHYMVANIIIGLIFGAIILSLFLTMGIGFGFSKLFI